MRHELRSFFKPEFLNRLDAVVIFDRLQKENLEKIAERLLRDLQKRLSGKGYRLSWDEETLRRFAAEGYDPVYGARPLRRLIIARAEEPIAEAILQDRLAAGDEISFTNGEMAIKKAACL